MFHDSSGTTAGALESNSRRYGDWNVTGQARPKSRRCLILPACCDRGLASLCLFPRPISHAGAVGC